jgi:hypothetical protein
MNIVRICLYSLFAAILLSVSLLAQERLALSRRVIVFCPNQDALSGRLIRVGDSSISVLTAKREEKILFENISRIVLSGEKKASKGVVYGAILGGYGAVAILGQSENYTPKPTGYLMSNNLSTWVFLLIVTPSILAGGGIGYLIDPGSDGTEEMFYFTGSEDSRNAERQRLTGALSNVERDHTVHLSVQGSQVYPSVIKRDESQSSYGGGFGYGGYNNVMSFNIYRRVQLTYTIHPNVEVGIASVLFGEPSQYIDINEYSSSGNSRYGNTQITLDAVGRYAVVAYMPFPELSGGPYEISLGGGIGIAAIDYERQSFVTENTVVNGIYTTTTKTSTFKFSENLVTGYLYGQASAELIDGLTIGLVLDHVFAPSKEAPADVVFGMARKTLPFGNTSLGFTIGLHF